MQREKRDEDSGGDLGFSSIPATEYNSIPLAGDAGQEERRGDTKPAHRGKSVEVIDLLSQGDEDSAEAEKIILSQCDGDSAKAEKIHVLSQGDEHSAEPGNVKTPRAANPDQEMKLPQRKRRRKAEEEANAGGAAAPGAGLAVDTSAAERKSTTPSDSSKDFKEGKSPKGGNKKSSKK